jgi:hypothetical protein
MCKRIGEGRDTQHTTDQRKFRPHQDALQRRQRQSDDEQPHRPVANAVQGLLIGQRAEIVLPEFYRIIRSGQEGEDEHHRLERGEASSAVGPEADELAILHNSRLYAADGARVSTIVHDFASRGNSSPASLAQQEEEAPIAKRKEKLPDSMA